MLNIVYPWFCFSCLKNICLVCFLEIIIWDYNLITSSPILVLPLNPLISLHPSLFQNHDIFFFFIKGVVISFSASFLTHSILNYVSANRIRFPHPYWLKHNTKSSIWWIQGFSVNHHMYRIMLFCYSLYFQPTTRPCSVHVLIPMWNQWILLELPWLSLDVMHFRVLIVHSKCSKLIKGKWFHYIKAKILNVLLHYISTCKQ